MSLLTMHHLENVIQMQWNLSNQEPLPWSQRNYINRSPPLSYLLGSVGQRWVSENTTWRRRNVEGTKGVVFYARGKW